MGIPGILKEIGKGDRIALAKLSVEHLERTGRPFRIAIDAAIWSFQNQAGQGGANPALRTLFYRLLKLFALPIHPVFVYDGRNKPLTKRNKTVASYGSCLPNDMSKQLIRAFTFPHHHAPGEAEAECALLQRMGIVDAVMSQDVDAMMFGSTVTLRNWSQEGIRGNKTPTHVDLHEARKIKVKTKLDADAMILVALLSGGDYNPDGVSGIGPALACEIAKAGFGSELAEHARRRDVSGLQEWRERLQYELETNESGYFKTKHKLIKIPGEFPDLATFGYYADPAVSSPEQLQQLEAKWIHTWNEEIDLPAMRAYVAEKFEWLYQTGAKKLVRNMAPALVANRLFRELGNASITKYESITERRMHFSSDGIPELRVSVIPADIVGLDLESEEDPPITAEEAQNPENEDANEPCDEPEHTATQTIPAKRTRKSPPWDPHEPTKIWIPETIAKLGIPALVEEWEQEQRDILADPKKFVAKRCVKGSTKATATETNSKSRTLHGFFTAAKPSTLETSSSHVAANTSKPLGSIQGNAGARAGERAIARTPTRRAAKKMAPSLPNIAHYFRSPTKAPQLSLDRKKGPSKTTIADPILISSSPPALPLSQHLTSSISPCPPPITTTQLHESDIAADIPPIASLLTPISSSFSPSSATATVANSPRQANRQLTAVLRDSLPGTWREARGVEDEQQQQVLVLAAVSTGSRAGPTRQRRRPRLSVLDLTGD